MSSELVCPSCHCRLRLKEGIKDRLLSCPRCLGRVPYLCELAPQGAAYPTRSPEAITAEQPGQTDRESITVQPRPYPSADFDAERDTRGTGWFLALFAVLAIIGALVPVMTLRGDRAAPLGIWLLTFAFVALVVGAVAMVLWPHAPRLRTAGWAVLAIFGVVGGMVVAIAGLLIVFLLVCGAAFRAGGPWRL
jgi:hypothetical protein